MSLKKERSLRERLSSPKNMSDVNLITRTKSIIKETLEELKVDEPKEMCNFLKIEVTHSQIVSIAKYFESDSRIYKESEKYLPDNLEDLTIKEICSLIRKKNKGYITIMDRLTLDNLKWFKNKNQAEPREMCEFLKTELTMPQIKTVASFFGISEKELDEKNIQEICDLIKKKDPQLFKSKNKSRIFQILHRKIVEPSIGLNKYRINFLFLLLLILYFVITLPLINKVNIPNGLAQDSFCLFLALSLIKSAEYSSFEIFKKSSELYFKTISSERRKEHRINILNIFKDQNKQLNKKIQSIKRKSLRKKTIKKAIP